MTTKSLTFKVIATTATALAGVAAQAQVTSGTLTEPTVATPFISNIPPGAAASWDPVYSVCRGPDPRCYHPWVKSRQNKVLIYSRTAGPRHAALGTALAAGLNPPLNAASNIMQSALISWLAAVGVSADWTEDVGTFASANLNNYKAIIFADTSREVFWKHGTAISPTYAVNTTTNGQLEAAKTAVMQYMRAGGGAMLIHNAVGGTDYQWAYFTGLAGSQYYDHGALQTGQVYVVDPTDASTVGIPARFTFEDEWYNFYPYPERVKFVAMVDESTLPTKSTVHPGHGSVHPVAWCQYFDGGREYTMELGHDSLAWTDGSNFPSQAIFHQFVIQATLSVMGNTPQFCGFSRS